MLRHLAPRLESPAAGEAHATLALPESGGALVLGRFKLRAIEGPDRVTFKSTDVRTVIGTAESADLRLTDPTVSRFHCEIVVVEGEIRVRDLGSTNRTVVNGVTVGEARLDVGAVLRLGNTLLQFEPAADDVRIRLADREAFGSMVGRSRAARRAFALLEHAAASDATVLLQGETGTGKEIAAESIHHESARREGPFVVVDCAAIPANLLESELFGHERGAFTGAERPREGAFEAANGGTIFLDELGELAADLQPKLLRALESRVVKRLGSQRPIPVDVRVIAATNRDLRRQVNAGVFRSDLYFRLAVLEIVLPPLRERPDDLPLLVERMLAVLGAGETAAALTRTGEFRDALLRHDWPGNVRELRNYVERCITTHGAELEIAPLDARPAPALESSARVDVAEPLRTARERAIDRFERAYLEAILDAHAGNVSAAARAARVDRVHFHRLLRRHGVRRSAD